MGKTRGHHVDMYIYRQLSPLCLQLFCYSNVSLYGRSKSSFQGKRSHDNVWSRISLHIALESNLNIP